MSCERNGSKFGGAAAVKNGVTTMASKAGNTIGVMASKVGATGKSIGDATKSGVQASGNFVKSGAVATKNKAKETQGQAMKTFVGKPASVTLNVANNFDMPTMKSLAPLAAVGALVGGGKTRLAILNSVATLQVGQAVTGGIGTGIARYSRDNGAGPVQELNYFDRPQISIQAYSSRLSTAINAKDIRGWPVSAKQSSGRVYENRGQAWHMGVTTVETPQGESRAIAHLQSLNLPSTHYYFNRALRDGEVAGIISNHHAFPAPRNLKGFLGQVSEVESLAPSVSYLKHRLIQAHAFFGKEKGE